jgi:Fe2+ transport system protein FeoA/Mn-dependent DtxR family transcriptional regulator
MVGACEHRERERRNEVSGLTQWLWPALTVLLAALWVWKLLRQREEQGQAPAAPYEQMEAEDVLKAAYVLQEERGQLTHGALASALRLPESLTNQALAALMAFDWAEEGAEGRFHLTDEGTARAQDLIRAHRLWERYLVDREGMRLDAVHAEAHRREHSTTQEELERLDAELGHPAWDPHGHAIPGPRSQLPSSPGRPLSAEAEPGKRFRIVSIDDDPAPLLAQLVALGLEPGTDIEIVDREPDLLHLHVDGEHGKPTIPLAHAAAERVFVVPAAALPLELGRLPVGARARVVEVRGDGRHQRRMLDMGFVPGAEVTVLRKASLGDPTEYRVKGTGVAMRRTDANSVMVEEMANGS